MTIDLHHHLSWKQLVIAAGYERDVTWAESVRPVDLPCKLVAEYIWVVLNSGMRNQVAEVIARRVKEAQLRGDPVRSVFNHPGKAAAIERATVDYVIWRAANLGWL